MPATPAAIALPDIAASAETTIQRLRAIEVESAPDDRAKAIAEGLPKRSDDIDKGVTAVEEAIATRAGLDRLIDHAATSLATASSNRSRARALTSSISARRASPSAEISISRSSRLRLVVFVAGAAAGAGAGAGAGAAGGAAVAARIVGTSATPTGSVSDDAGGGFAPEPRLAGS